MKTHTITMIKQVLIGTLLFGSLLMGAEQPSTNAKQDTIAHVTELLNLAGKQRMLSQRIAKDYLYVGKKIAVDKATRELDQSLKAFKKAQKYLKETIKDPEIQNLIAFVNLSENELEETAKKPFTLDNAQLVLDLSESILEGSQYIVDSLKSHVKKKDSVIVAISGKQRMLAQRIAKYYIAYQSGIKDKNTVEQMKATVKLFDENNNALLGNVSNTAEISQQLKRIDMLWKIVYKFYLNIEKGGLPFIVFTSTDNITHKMDQVTDLYSKLNL